MLIQLSTATSGTFTAINTQQDLVMVHEAGVTLSFTWAFPANPTDGQTITMLSTGGITSLNISAVVGPVINALTGMAAGTPAMYIYIASTNKCYKIR